LSAIILPHSTDKILVCVDRMPGAAGDCKQFNGHSVRRWTGKGNRRPGSNVLRRCTRTARRPRRSSRRLAELLYLSAICWVYFLSIA